MNNSNQLSFLDILTILSFIVGLYALQLAEENLVENRQQSKDTEEILNQLEGHLKSQDNHLKAQDLHLAQQDKLLRKED